MKRIPILLAAILAMAAAPMVAAQNNGDWANYGRYAEANAALKTQILEGRAARPDAVFIGNSITDGWARKRPQFFASGNYTGRGIGGQVTAQMLARFRADVIDLAPRVVVILAGTNDIACNQGPVAVENIFGNIVSMAELAAVHGIDVVICSVLPAAEYPWRREIKDVPVKVRALNALLEEWAGANGAVWVDYFTAMADRHGGLPAELAADGIHPTDEGYKLMESIIEPALDKILKHD